MQGDEGARALVRPEEVHVLDVQACDVNARGEHEEGHREDGPHRLHAGAAAGGVMCAGMARLEDEQLFPRELVHPPLDLVDPSKNIFERPRMVDGGAHQPHLREGDSGQEDDLARRGHHGDAAQECRQRRLGHRNPPIQARHAECHQRVQHLVLFH